MTDERQYLYDPKVTHFNEPEPKPLANVLRVESIPQVSIKRLDATGTDAQVPAPDAEAVIPETVVIEDKA
jgi:hypothetical protein